MTYIELSLGSTIYQLNTSDVALLSVFVLHEDLTATKPAGIGIGVLAVLTLVHRTHETSPALHRGHMRRPSPPRDPADALDEAPPPDLADRFHRDHPRYSSVPQSAEV